MYRKFSAANIFNGYEFLQNRVLITDIAGEIIDLVAENEAGEGVEKLNGLLCPGFINVHCHLELSHMKGHIPKHTGLVDFVLKVVQERHFTDDEIKAAIERAENEMLQNGIVAVGDICNNTLTIPQKNKGRLLYHNFIETAGFIPSLANNRFDKSLAILEAYRSSIKYQVSSINPHAPYSVSAELFGLINEHPNNDLITIHNQETDAENEFFENGTGDLLRLYEQMGIDISFYKPSGKTSLQTWLPHFTKQQSIILVHNVATAEADLEFTKLRIPVSSIQHPVSNIQHPASSIQHPASGIQTPDSGFQTFLCLCPNANLYISNTLPDINMLMKHTDNIVLGTDSLASNDALSILAEVKTLQQHFKNPDLATLLKWATSNGARALQMDDSLGSFEKGKRPGVVLIEAADLQKLDKASVKRIL